MLGKATPKVVQFAKNWANFEKYVEQLLTRMFGSNGGILLDGQNQTLKDAAKSSARAKSKLADFVLFVDEIVLVVETKARFFSRAARTGESWQELSSRLDDIYSRGARQLEAIELCEDGAPTARGIDPAKVAAHVPLLISIDETPLTPHVYDLITPVRPAVGADKTVPLQVAGVSELEPLEADAADRRLNVLALLGYKGSCGKQAESLRNAVFHQPSLRDVIGHNPLLARVYRDAMEGAQRTLQVRAR